MKPWEDPSIYVSIYVEQALEIGAVYEAFANDLEAVIMPRDSETSRILREDVARARDLSRQWFEYAKALEEPPDGGGG